MFRFSFVANRDVIQLSLVYMVADKMFHVLQRIKTKTCFRTTMQHFASDGETTVYKR